MIRGMEIGKSGVKAPQFILGTFAYGGGTSWQDTTEDDQALVQMIRDAYDEAGVWGIDTAPVYGTGRSERIVGEAIRDRREKYFLATKCSLNWRSKEGKFTYTRDGYSVYNNFSKDAITQDCEESLKRLGTDYLDLLIIHRCPAADQMKEAVEAVQALRERGLVRATGLSNAMHREDPITAVRDALQYGEIDLLQEGASLLKRAYAEKMTAFCEANQITFQAHTSLEKGALAGKIIENVTSWEGDNRSKYKWFQSENLPKLNELNRTLGGIAEKYGCSVPVLALAWMKQLSPCVNLLVGARKMSHLMDSIRALDLVINEDDVKKMNKLSDEVNR